MKRQYIVMMPLLLTLAACTQESKNIPQEQSSLVPPSIGFQKPVAGASLTQDQISEIKKTFTGQPMMTLPPGDLVFPSADANPETIRHQEDQLRYQDPNAYALMLDVRKNCGKGHPSLNADATFPMDRVDATNAIDVLQKGDRISYGGKAGLVDNSNCPLDLGGSFNMKAEVKDTDRAARTGAVSAGLGGKLKFVMKNQKYAQLLNSRGMIVDTNLSGVVVAREQQTDGQGKALVTFNLSGSYLSLKADIPYNVQFKVLASNPGDEEPKVETVYTATLKYPKFSASLVGHETRVNNQVVSTELYLNGRAVSPEELQKIFGDNVPGQASQKQITEALLN